MASLSRTGCIKMRSCAGECKLELARQLISSHNPEPLMHRDEIDESSLVPLQSRSLIGVKSIMLAIQIEKFGGNFIRR